MSAAKEINNIKELVRRLKKLYFYEDLINGEYYPLHLKRCKIYLKVNKLKKQKFSRSEISKKLNLTYGQVDNNFKRKPYLILLAQSIPNKKLKRGYKLLPLHSKKGGHSYNTFIIVPFVIETYKEIRFIINQLGRKSSDYNKKEKYFAYILGMMISDTSKPKGYKFSNQCLIALTRKYSWSLDVGNYLCKCFNFLGIKANRIKDNSKLNKLHPNGDYRWISEKSPFIKFLIQTCLGLKENQMTTYNKVKMKWLLNCSNKFLIPFIQGVCDGDGSAHNFWRIEISCDPNKDLFIKILTKLNIKSYNDGDAVSISNEKSIIKASKLNLFLNAKGRKIKLEKIVKMIKKRVYLKDLNQKIKNIIISLKDKKLSAGKISDYIFDSFKISISPSSVYEILKK